MITMSNNHPESQNAILPNTEIPNAEPLLQPISEMTADDIMKEAIRRGFTPIIIASTNAGIQMISVRHISFWKLSISNRKRNNLKGGTAYHGK